jgi:hypothetical protein
MMSMQYMLRRKIFIPEYKQLLEEVKRHQTSYTCLNLCLESTRTYTLLTTKHNGLFMLVISIGINAVW